MSDLTDALARKNIHVFRTLQHIKNEQGRELDFKEHGFLWDIYTDFTPVQAIRKAAQIGFSTLAIVKSLFIAKNLKMDCIYTLPTANDVRDFVSGKVNRIITQNPVFQAWTADKDSIEQKKVGDNVIYYRGTFTEREALMITADLLINDEVDRSNLPVIEQYDSRLQHSKYGWKWQFSNPSVPGIGADKLWEISDQKHWFIQCESCKKEQYMTMLNVKPGAFVCVKCGRPIDRRKGRWVKRWRNRDISGYWISLLMAPWVEADKILELERTKSPEYFDNFVLGVPHVGSGNLVSRDMLFRNLVNETNPQDGHIVIGVDTGVELHYVCANERGLFHYGKYRSYADLEMLLKRWPKSIMVIDQGGDIIGSRKLREAYPHRVYLCFFQQDRKTEEIIRWGKADERGTVLADRNRLMQLVIDEFTDKRIPIWGQQEEWEEFWQHWSHIYRSQEEDNLGVMRYKWMRNDRDDWVLATCYARVAMYKAFHSEGALLAPSERFGSMGLEITNGRAFVPILSPAQRNSIL